MWPSATTPVAQGKSACSPLIVNARSATRRRLIRHQRRHGACHGDHRRLHGRPQRHPERACVCRCAGLGASRPDSHVAPRHFGLPSRPADGPHAPRRRAPARAAAQPQRRRVPHVMAPVLSACTSHAVLPAPVLATWDAERSAPARTRALKNPVTFCYPLAGCRLSLPTRSR